MITRGSCTSAPASATFCRMPRENPSQRSCACGARPSQPISSRARASATPAVDAPEPGDEFEIFERRQLVVDHRLVGDPGHDLLGRDRIGQRVDAEDRDRPRIRAQQSDHHPQGRGLAGAVRAKQRIELARPHREIEAVDRRPIEALGEAENFQRPKGLNGLRRDAKLTRDLPRYGAGGGFDRAKHPHPRRLGGGGQHHPVTATRRARSGNVRPARRLGTLRRQKPDQGLLSKICLIISSSHTVTKTPITRRAPNIISIIFVVPFAYDRASFKVQRTDRRQTIKACPPYSPKHYRLRALQGSPLIHRKGSGGRTLGARGERPKRRASSSKCRGIGQAALSGDRPARHGEKGLRRPSLVDLQIGRVHCSSSDLVSRPQFSRRSRIASVYAAFRVLARLSANSRSSGASQATRSGWNSFILLR